MAEVLINEDDEVASVAVKEPQSKPSAIAPKRMSQLSSPLLARPSNNNLRPRKGYHQTWKREDEVEQAKEVGYVNIQKQNPAKSGTEKAGAETGEVQKRIEVGYRDRYEYAMECSEAAYQAHINYVSAKSHSMYGNQADVLREFAEGKNRDYGSKREVLHVVAPPADNEDQMEEIS